MSFLRDAAVELAVALKGHTLPKKAETALHRLSNEIVRSQEADEAQKKRKHSCPEWDYMVIDEDSPEFEACLCYEGIDCTDEQLMEEVRRRGFVIRDAQIERDWIGLTVKEVLELLPSSKWKAEETLLFVQRIEDELKEKNT